MGLIARLKDKDTLLIKLEDGRTIRITIDLQSKFRLVTYIEADKSIRIDRIKNQKDESDDRRHPGE